MNPRYNLLDEPWIPVRKGGATTMVGLKEALLWAHEIEALALASPLEEAALTRLMLAVLHRALDGPQGTNDLRRIYQEGRFPEDTLKDYLERWRDRFYLFHPEVPFFQVADLPEELHLPWTKLLPEFASGNNPTLFDHTFDDTPPAASLAQAARALVAHQSFVPGGLLKRYGVSSAPGGPLAVSAVFLPQGSNLFETMVLTLVPYEAAGDAPLWEEPPLRFKDLKEHRTRRPRTGRTRTYTWLSRALKLLPEEDTVRFILYGPGVCPEEVLEPDPFCAYREDKQARLVPVRLSEEKAFWRDFAALLPPRNGGSRLPPRVISIATELLKVLSFPLKVLGQVTDQAKVLSVRREVYPFPPRALAEEVAEEIEVALEVAEGLGAGLRGLARSMAEELLSLTRSPDPNEVKALARSLGLEISYWSELDRAFPSYLLILAEDSEAAWRLWQGSIEKAARSAWSICRQAAGTRPRALKALARGEAVLRRLLQKHLEEVS